MTAIELQLISQITALWRERAELRERLGAARAQLLERGMTAHEAFTIGLFTGRAIAELENAIARKRGMRS